MLTYEQAKNKIYQYLQENIDAIQEDNPLYKEYELIWREEYTVEFERGWVMKYGLGDPFPETPIPTKIVNGPIGTVLIVDKYIPQCIDLWDRIGAEFLIRDYMSSYDKGFEVFKDTAYCGETAKILPVKW